MRRWLLPLCAGALVVTGLQPAAAQAEPADRAVVDQVDRMSIDAAKSSRTKDRRAPAPGAQDRSAQAGTASAADVAANQAVDEGSTFVPTTPVRVLDSRNGTGAPAGPVGYGVYVDLASRLPASATAVVLNLTGLQATEDTHIRVAPNDSEVPEVSNLNLRPGEIRANQVTVALDRATRSAFLYNNAGFVHLIADLAGYYVSDGGSSRFTTTSPTRALDTRLAGGALGAGTARDVDLSGLVPTTATSVTFNLTGVLPTADTHVVAYPTGGSRPNVSNLNLVAGQIAPNLVTVALGTNRRVTLYNNAGSTHLIADLVGYYAGDRGQRFFPVAPSRALDTRYSTGGAVGPASVRTVDLAPRIASTATAVVVNLTGTGVTQDTHVTAYAAGSGRPTTSNLNLFPGQDTANAAVVALQGDVRMSLYNNSGWTHLIADVAGFFATPTACTGACLHGWGGNLAYGTTPTQRPWLSNATAVEAGPFTAYARRSDGTVWSWGDNYYGQLGAGGYDGSSPVPLRVAGLTGVTAVDAGTGSGYALKSDGTVWAWGENYYGQLGTVGGYDSPVPVQVQGLTGVTAIAATHATAYALKSDGTVWAWGSDEWGGLGAGTCPAGQSCPAGTPVRVSLPLPTGTRITAIATGTLETAYALRSDGTVWSWGRNFAGETGTGAALETGNAPAQVRGLTDVVKIAGGEEVGYAVTANGALWAWGNDFWGSLGNGWECTELGNGNSCRSDYPVKVPNVVNPSSIDSSYGTTLVRQADGSVLAWGYNGESGSVGNGTAGSCDQFPLTSACRVSSPVTTSITGVSEVAAGGIGQFAIVAG
ncbi:RCC1 domain-containing protein [Saccharothrix sp. Mg75]|uniref:RCC1 domain-containing protein n=1 Tax=Saccharothrix sp. Mg75 TaxID=3445357 RepID=UPI003EED9845